MPTKSRYVEKLTILALVATVAMSFYYWDFVHKAFTRTHNTLGETNVHVPTADLFLWCVFALILYFGTRFWATVSPTIFRLTPESAARLAFRLQVARVLSTFTLFGLTVRTIHTYVPDFIDKLPWP